MYAYVCGMGRGFFEGLCTLSNVTAHFRDPPPPLDSRIDAGDAPWLLHQSGFIARLVETDSGSTPSKHFRE
jgi:hypothetical protein